VPRQHRRPQRQDDDLTAFFTAVPWWVLPIALLAVDGSILGVAHANDWPWPITKLLLIAATLVIGAAGTAGQLKKAEHRKLLASARQLEDLRALTALAFEELVLAAYRKKGWSGSLTGRGADGGVDVILEQKGEKVFVQCKRWKQTIPVDAVRALKGSMATEGVAKGIFVCCGRFTAEAEPYAASSGITTVGGEALLQLVREASGDTAIPRPTRHAQPTMDPVAAAEPPLCPRCQFTMVMRSGSRGRFWGCAQFPACRGTRELETQP
jgi:restriction system protein